MVQPPLTTEAVTVNTVEIKVHVIRIGNRQMTLSVFNQLQQTESANLHHISHFEKGIQLRPGVQPWGYVLTKDGPWLVFSIGNRLYRESYKHYWDSIEQLVEQYGLEQLFIAV